MRVLWVTAEPPDRNAGGSGIRQANLIAALAGAAHVDLLLVGHLQDSLTISTLGNVTEIPVVDLPPSGRAARRVRSLADALRQHPPELTAYRGVLPDLRNEFARLTSGFHYDRVVIDHIGLAPLIRRDREPDWALTFHNIASETLRQESDLVGGRRRLLLRRQATQAANLESWAMGKYGRVFSVCEEDAALLPGPSTVVPNGVDVGRYSATALPSAPRVVMVGTLGYRPNVDGLQWFFDEVLPLVRVDVPDVIVTLVGRQPTPEIFALAERPGVELHIDVPDVRPHLETSRLAIVPLRFGTGTRLKALEAFAAGRPVVGTSVGLAGLGIRSTRDALVADTSIDFARAATNVLTDDRLASDMAASARRLVEERFDWPGIGRRFAEALLGDP